MSTSWKAAESRIGIYYGAKGIGKSGRQPLSGGNSGITRGDAPHPTIFIESKRDKRYHSAIKLWRKYRIKGDIHALMLPQVKNNKVISRFSDIWCIHCDDLSAISDRLSKNINIRTEQWLGPYPSALSLYEESISVKNSTLMDKCKEIVTCNLVYHGHKGFWIIINKHDIIRCWELILDARKNRERALEQEQLDRN